jgi:ParB family transcriptional regulator, chromosome partitioning protein
MVDIDNLLRFPETSITAGRYAFIPIDQIKPSPHQARKNFDEESLEGLAESMKQEGLIEPIVVRKIIPSPLMGEGRDRGAVPPPSSSPTWGEESMFELVSGERRLRAAMMLGWTAIEAKIIQTISEGEAAAKSLIENIQREDLNPIEEAEAFAGLNQTDPDYWNQEKIAQVSGKDKTYISRSLSLLELPDPVKEKLRCRNLTRNHGVELCRLKTPAQQMEVAEQIGDRLTVMETRQLVDSINGLKTDTNDSISQPNSRPASPPPSRSTVAVDPLADLWPKLSSDTDLSPKGHWKVKYDGGGWSFWVANDTQEAKTAIAKWFSDMAKSLLHNLEP